MSEAEVIASSTRGPVTREWLARDLQALGVRPGALHRTPTDQFA